MYIKTNDRHQVSALSLEPFAGFRESTDNDELAIAAFLVKAQQQDDLLRSDLELVRVLEDLIEVLVSCGAIRFTDLPQPAQDKLNKRRTLRDSINALNLLDLDNDLI